MVKPFKRSFTFEFKLEVVRRFLAGETKVALARNLDLSSPKLIETWARTYRNEGADGLRPKRAGRPPNPAGTGSVEASELEQLRRENERLRAEVAYLGKLRALRAQERQRRSTLSSPSRPSIASMCCSRLPGWPGRRSSITRPACRTRTHKQS
ncbi:hypothetical protein GCM10027068_39370 [Prescottella soli]